MLSDGISAKLDAQEARIATLEDELAAALQPEQQQQQQASPRKLIASPRPPSPQRR